MLSKCLKGDDQNKKKRRKTMRKHFLTSIFVISITASFLCLFVAPFVNAQQKVTLSVSHYWPASHYIQTEQYARYFKMVEKAANGKYTLDIKWYPGETLLKATDTYDGVIKKIADIGVTSLGYHPGRFVASLALSQSGTVPVQSSVAACKTVWEFYKKLKPKEFDEVKVLYLSGTGPGWIHSNKPIRKVEDLKGMKIRVTGAGVAGVKAVGGEPVAMPMSEVYIAAKKGTIDALLAPNEVLKAWKHAEVFKYSTFMPFFYSEYYFLYMNRDSWQALPKDLQAAFDAVADNAVEMTGQIWDYFSKDAEDFAKKLPGGHEFIYLSDTETAKMNKALNNITEEYIATMNSKGLNGKEIVAEVRKIAAKYNKEPYKPWKP